jgi:hypothetical protein
MLCMFPIRAEHHKIGACGLVLREMMRLNTKDVLSVLARTMSARLSETTKAWALDCTSDHLWDRETCVCKHIHPPSTNARTHARTHANTRTHTLTQLTTQKLLLCASSKPFSDVIADIFLPG